MNKPYRTLIADDERPVRTYTKHILKQYEEVFHIIGEAADGEEAIEKINTLQPDIVFLDIQMPGITGLELIQHLHHQPIIIFLTAYDHYALQAFDANGIDYLLKPLDAARLQQTIEKLNKLQQQPAIDLQLLQTLLKTPASKTINSITLKQGSKYILVPVTEVAAFESKEKYTNIKTIDGNSYLDNDTLTAWEEKLPDNFLRIQKGAIINTKEVFEIHKHFNNRFQFVMKDKHKTTILSGTSYVNAIREKLNL
jgi:two-component system, LytTR family, response regulator